MRLSETDEELLEQATLRLPWYMVCGDFHGRYGSAARLSHRLIAMRDAGLIRILCCARGAPQPDAATLEADALANDCYRSLEDTREPEWEFVTTDLGYARVRYRLGGA